MAHSIEELHSGEVLVDGRALVGPVEEVLAVAVGVLGHGHRVLRREDDPLAVAPGRVGGHAANGSHRNVESAELSALRHPYRIYKSCSPVRVAAWLKCNTVF